MISDHLLHPFLLKTDVVGCSALGLFSRRFPPVDTEVTGQRDSGRGWLTTFLIAGAYLVETLGHVPPFAPKEPSHAGRGNKATTSCGNTWTRVAVSQQHVMWLYLQLKYAPRSAMLFSLSLNAR